MKRIGKIIKNLLFCLLLFISAIVFSKFIAQKCFNNYYFLGYNTSYILTGSMEPTLKIDDYVLSVKTKNVKEGDIIVFKDSSDKYVIHRIVEISGDTITTKGDYNNTNDKPITINQVEGKYVKTLLHSSVFTNYFKSSLFKVTIIIVFGVVIIAYIKLSSKGSDECDEKKTE